MSRWRLPLAMAAVFLLALGGGYAMAVLGSKRAAEHSPAGSPPSSQQSRDDQRRADAAVTGYRIKLMEEVAPEKGWKEEAVAPQVSRRRIGPAEVLVRPRGEVLLSVIVDASRALATPEGEALLEEMRGAIEDLASPPRDTIRLAVRTAGSGDEDDCAESRMMMMPAALGRETPSRIAPGGPRNLSQAMYRAAGDMASRQGHKGMVVVTTGDEECGQWPCETARTLFQTRDGYRTWAYWMQPTPALPPETPSEPAEPAADVPTPPNETAQPAPPPKLLECVGASAGGRVGTVRGRAELASALRGVIDDLSTNLTVRLQRTSNGRELSGDSQPSLPWRVRLESAGDGSALASQTLPARFLASVGRWRVTLEYAGAVLSLDDLVLAANEETEIIFHLVAGQLTVSPAGRGWPASGDCVPRITVSPAAGGSTAIAERCGLPASFVLPPGDYLVAVGDGGADGGGAEVSIRDGYPSVVTVTPGSTPEIAVDKRGAAQ